ncbi:Shikimate transporter [Carbonactinospora thermoautotrophica]|uniref:Shikimate transporter n=1 Tax=Carbonactinospora thermoautotrophica TaxID=1469144 RepID=A0A132MSJ6_9ACTN|nr:MFS transporter [Carbonactinospora thermoautotrophica]KWX00858.1 Shikimate transporter [Carbonactinospora thermoautotrophica]
MTTAAEVRLPFPRLAVACCVGTALEYFDFFIYGTAAALVFNRIFFVADDPWFGTFYALATFAIGFAARPVGAILFGHFGDRIGRRRVLVVIFAAMGLATLLIGLLPGYHAIGVAAPVALVLLRIIHGLCVGGEAGGATLLAVEHAPVGQRAWYGSLVALGSPLGALLANGSFAAVVLLPPDALLDWGWRVPFLAGVAVVFVGLFARNRLQETPVFERVRAARAVERIPLATVVRRHLRLVLLTAAANLGFSAFIFIQFNFLLAYGPERLGLPRSTVLNATLAGCLAQAIGIMVFCRLSDRVGRRPVLLTGAVFTLLFSFPLFWLVDTGKSMLILVAMVLGAAGSAALFGPMLTYFAELFGPALRYTGVGIGYQLGAVLGGGLSPLIANRLVAATGGSASVSAYLVVALLISIGALAALPETVPHASWERGTRGERAELAA